MLRINRYKKGVLPMRANVMELARVIHPAQAAFLTVSKLGNETNALC